MRNSSILNRYLFLIIRKTVLLCVEIVSLPEVQQQGHDFGCWGGEVRRSDCWVENNSSRVETDPLES